MTLIWKCSKCRSLRRRNLSTKPDFSRWKGAATANFWTDRDNSSCVTTDKFTGPGWVAMLTSSNRYECSRKNNKNWIHHNKYMQMQPPKIENFTSSLAVYTLSPTKQSSLTPKLLKYSQAKTKQPMTKIEKPAFRFRNPHTHVKYTSPKTSQSDNHEIRPKKNVEKDKKNRLTVVKLN